MAKILKEASNYSGDKGRLRLPFPLWALGAALCLGACLGPPDPSPGIEKEAKTAGNEGMPGCLQGEIQGETCTEGVRSRVCVDGEFAPWSPCETEIQACQDAEEIFVGSRFFSGPTSNAIEGSCGGAGGESIFRFVAPATGRYRVFVKSQAHATLHLRSVCGRDDSELACESGPTPQQALAALTEIQLAQDQTISVVVDFDGFPAPFSLSVLRMDGGCFGQGEHLEGEGDGIKVVIVPCRFGQEDEAEFLNISAAIAEAFTEVEPYQSNTDKFSVYRVADFSAANVDPGDNYACKDSSVVAQLASSCPYDRVIALSKGNELSLAGGVTAMVAVSSNFPAQNAPGVSLHETGHLLGLEAHPCLDGPEPTEFMPPNLANCAATQISADEPCAEWSSQEYLDWVLPGDPPFDCFPGCSNNTSLYRPWQGDIPFQGSIMCHTTQVLSPGFTPVDRKILYDRLRLGADG
jgi:hypothetical protein